MNIQNKPYIRVTDDDDTEPTDNELGLDFSVDMEYTSPYQDDYSDIMDVGGVIEAGGIFDDR